MPATTTEPKPDLKQLMPQLVDSYSMIPYRIASHRDHWRSR